MSATVKRLEAFKSATGLYTVKPAPQGSTGEQLSRAKQRLARQAVTLERVARVRKVLRQMTDTNVVDEGDKAIVRFILRELTKAIHGKRGEG